MAIFIWLAFYAQEIELERTYAQNLSRQYQEQFLISVQQGILQHNNRIKIEE